MTQLFAFFRRCCVTDRQHSKLWVRLFLVLFCGCIANILQHKWANKPGERMYVLWVGTFMLGVGGIQIQIWTLTQIQMWTQTQIWTQTQMWTQTQIQMWLYCGLGHKCKSYSCPSIKSAWKLGNHHPCHHHHPHHQPYHDHYQPHHDHHQPYHHHQQPIKINNRFEMRSISSNDTGDWSIIMQAISGKTSSRTDFL